MPAPLPRTVALSNAHIGDDDVTAWVGQLPAGTVWAPAAGTAFIAVTAAGVVVAERGAAGDWLAAFAGVLFGAVVVLAGLVWSLANSRVVVFATTTGVFFVGGPFPTWTLRPETIESIDRSVPGKATIYRHRRVLRTTAITVNVTDVTAAMSPSQGHTAESCPNT